MYTVYKHVNKKNNKCYIGITCQSVNDRWRSDGSGYKGQPKFWNAIQLYGWENFEHIIIASNMNKEDACLLEKTLIKEYDSIENGYNIELGGMAHQHSIETIEKIRNSMYGHFHTQETKDKISQSKNNIKRSVVCIETQKTYASIKEASLDTGIDASSISRVCRNISHSAGGYHWHFYEKPVNITYDNRSKPVLCITTNQAFKTIQDAAIATNSDASNIIKVCKGKYKTTNKLQWKYISIKEYLTREQGEYDEED